MRENCPHRLELETPRRRANALCIEAGYFPIPRCKLKPPDHWPEGMVIRWLWSGGGDPTVLGKCSRSCPMDEKKGEKS
jgi:hypothetical protein